MDDQQLEILEQQTILVETKWDRLELFRRLLTNSRLEQMYIIKRSTGLSESCPYFKRAKRLYQQDHEQEVLQQLKSLYLEFYPDKSSIEF